jgi:uncharacterized protein YoxC
MDWFIYGALIAGAVAIGVSTVQLVRQIKAAWRALKELQGRLAGTLGDLAERSEHTSEVVERLSERRDLETSLARLQISLARFAVLRQAMDEVSNSLTRVVSVYPRK